MLPVDSDAGGRGSPVGGGGSATSEKSSVRGKNLREGQNVTLRPAVLTSQHLYNLRNQGWGIPHPEYGSNSTGTSMRDPITLFHGVNNDYPSNADSVNLALYPNTSSDNDKDIERFNAKDLANNPLGSSPAPLGYFIIDALERGASRKSNMTQLTSQYTALTSYNISDIPIDKTSGGATVICEYAGRVFFAGFSGSIQSGDKNSPRMSSYVLFSQLVQDISNINTCYQAADPTNKDDSDLVDTDGGVIRVEGAYDINNMVVVGANLMVFATNGVWKISGGSGGAFKATSYQVDKITNSGCIAPDSVVVVNNAVIYWSRDGVYNIGPNQFGDYIADNISKKTIQTYYNEIDPNDSRSCQGVYDSYENKVRWIYGNRTTSTETRELILDLTLGAFYPFVFGKLDAAKYPMAVKGVPTEPFTLTSLTDSVLDNGSQVTVGGVGVVVDSDNSSSDVKEVKYLIITSITPSIKYAFGTYSVEDHYDWKSFNGVGVDATAYLLTGTMSGGDFQRKKDIQYVTFHFEKTEDGFTVDGSGDLTPTNKSGCLVQVQWDWSNNISSGKWTQPFQAYRIRRSWMPAEASSGYNNGYYVVETKTRLRGSGKVFSLYITSEPGKHMNLLGWSMKVNSNADV